MPHLPDVTRFLSVVTLDELDDVEVWELDADWRNPAESEPKRNLYGAQQPARPPQSHRQEDAGGGKREEGGETVSRRGTRAGLRVAVALMFMIVTGCAAHDVSLGAGITVTPEWPSDAWYEETRAWIAALRLHASGGDPQSAPTLRARSFTVRCDSASLRDAVGTLYSPSGGVRRIRAATSERLHDEEVTAQQFCCCQ